VQLVALVDHPDHVCCRYRLAAFRSLLQASGHDFELMALPRYWWQRLRLWPRLRGQPVVVQRRLLAGWELKLLRRSARWLLFDFDDAIFLRDSYHGATSSPRLLRRFQAMMRCADGVLAGNEFLEETARRWTTTARVEVFPTCVEPSRYPLAAHSYAGETQLVWIGSSSTLQGLEQIRPMLEQLGRACPHLRLRLVCDRFIKLRHLPVLPCPWSDATEAHDVAAADIGISWLPDDDWSRGKCGLKVLQYMAAGLPVIANPVGVQLDLVRHGENGYLAETPEEWINAVRYLANNPGLRRRMGAAGRQRVEQEFSVRAGAVRWRGVFAALEAQERRVA
jgi:glycosyltransferase involved in cell wall biosynthesis